MTLEQFVGEYGYWAILLLTFIEGETVVIVAGFFAHLGILNIYLVMLSALVGSFSGDQLYYYIGRHWGPRLIARRKHWQVASEKVYRMLHRHQYFLMLTFRFYYGLRNVTPFAIGSAQISRCRFFIFNLLGAVVWAMLFSFGGYFLGQTLQVFIDNYHQYALYFLGILVAVAALFWLVRFIRNQRMDRQETTQKSDSTSPNE